MGRAVKNFRTILHVITESSPKDESIFANIFFSDGNVYVSDKHILVTQSLKKHGFLEHEIEQMNGKHISGETYMEILTYNFVTVEDGYFVCRGLYSPDEIKYMLIENEDKMPDFNKLLKDTVHYDNELDDIYIFDRILSKSYSVLFLPMRMHFTFDKMPNAILVRSSLYEWSDETVVIMKRY